jgi:PAS domain S-box-containing protein
MISSQIQQEQTQRTLNKASVAVQQAQTPDQVYDAVAQEMDLLGYRALIFALSFDRKHLILERTAGTAEIWGRIERLTGLSDKACQIPLNTLSGHERILERLEAVFVPDVVPLVRMVLPKSIESKAEEVAATLSLHRGILAPLVMVGQAKGIVLVSADTLSEADLPAVTAFADQISAALERARLFSELREREWRANVAYEMSQNYAQELKEMVGQEQQRRAELDRLNTALRLFADQLQYHQDETAIALLLCEAVRDALGWRRAVVSLRDYQTMTSRPVAQVGYPPEITAQQMSMPPTPFGDAPWMRDEFCVSHSYYVPDVPAMLDSKKEERLTDSQEADQPADLLVVPLEAGGRILGMLSPSDREDRARPTRQQIEHLELFAVQAAIAIESIRLSKSVQMWADAVRHSGDAIFITDVEGRIHSANPAFEALTGYDLSEAAGQTARILESSLTPPSVYDKLWNTIQEGGVWRGEVINLRKDGSVYDADLTVAPILGASGEIIGYVGSQRDISPIRELDRLKSQFISNISHELRTPLTNIKLYQRYLREDRRPNLRERFFDILGQETKRLEQIIESLLDLSRLETGLRPLRVEVTDLNQVTSKIVAEHTPEAKARKITLSFEPSPGLAPVMTDQVQIGVALDNLVENALAYTPAGGSVQVRTHSGEMGIQISVHDTGHGIPPEEIEHVFEKFYRGQTPMALGIGGSGLGLSIVKQILDLHHGTIKATSQVDQGSVFTITLPGIQTLSNGPPVILLIENNPVDLAAMQNQLAEAGYWVSPATSGRDALAWLRQETPDLIVLDLSSLRMDSADLLDEIRTLKTGSALPVLVLTASERDPAAHSFALEADHYLPKPSSKEILVRTIQELVKPSGKLQR